MFVETAEVGADEELRDRPDIGIGLRKISIRPLEVGVAIDQGFEMCAHVGDKLFYGSRNFGIGFDFRECRIMKVAIGNDDRHIQLRPLDT